VDPSGDPSDRQKMAAELCLTRARWNIFSHFLDDNHSNIKSLVSGPRPNLSSYLETFTVDIANCSTGHFAASQTSIDNDSHQLYCQRVITDLCTKHNCFDYFDIYRADRGFNAFAIIVLVTSYPIIVLVFVGKSTTTTTKH
jgi:hypothetical protein